VSCRLCCASTSRNELYLGGGFEDSSAQLWQLGPSTFPVKDNSDGPSVIRLAADYLQTDDEENTEEPKK